MGKQKRQQERVIRLAKHHQWKCTPGYMLIAADRGAVRFEVPSGWYNDFWGPDGQPPSIRVCDVEPPDDSCRLVLSIVRFPMMDIDEMPLERLFPKLGGLGVHHLRRPGHKIAWTEMDVEKDRTNGRPIRTLLH